MSDKAALIPVQRGLIADRQCALTTPVHTEQTPPCDISSSGPTECQLWSGLLDVRSQHITQGPSTVREAASLTSELFQGPPPLALKTQIPPWDKFPAAGRRQDKLPFPRDLRAGSWSREAWLRLLAQLILLKPADCIHSALSSFLICFSN